MKQKFSYVWSRHCNPGCGILHFRVRHIATFHHQTRHFASPDTAYFSLHMVTDKIYTDRELALNNLNFCVPVLTSFHAPRKLLWQVSFVVFSVKSIGKTPFESTKINIFAKFLQRSLFWDSNLKGK